MTIRDNISPRERQVRETLAGLRDDEPDPEATARQRQLERWWFCRYCHAQNHGDGGECTGCGRSSG